MSVFTAEQVRHHPPVSAFHLENEQRGFVYCGWIYPKTQFGMNSFTTPIEGNMFVELKKYGEVYRLQYPPVKASGILFSTRMIQVTGSMEITCEKTNLKSVTHFSTTVCVFFANFVWISLGCFDSSLLFFLIPTGRR